MISPLQRGAAEGQAENRVLGRLASKRGPADQTTLVPLLGLSSVLRALVAGLILVALIPNLTLGAIFWLGVIDTPWSMPATQPPNESSTPAAQFAVPSPVLSSPATLEATAGECEHGIPTR